MGVTEHARRNAVGDCGPRLAEIGEFIDKGIAIVFLMEIHGDVGGASIVIRMRLCS